jgi:hypothetical protein
MNGYMVPKTTSVHFSSLMQGLNTVLLSVTMNAVIPFGCVATQLKK